MIIPLIHTISSPGRIHGNTYYGRFTSSIGTRAFVEGKDPINLGHHELAALGLHELPVRSLYISCRFLFPLERSSPLATNIYPRFMGLVRSSIRLGRGQHTKRKENRPQEKDAPGPRRYFFEAQGKIRFGLPADHVKSQ